jgi:hypothetical protein
LEIQVRSRPVPASIPERFRPIARIEQRRNGSEAAEHLTAKNKPLPVSPSPSGDNEVDDTGQFHFAAEE